LCDTFNKLKDGTIDEDAKNAVLTNLYDAFYEGEEPPEEEAENKKQLLDYFSRLATVDQTDLLEDKVCCEVSRLLSSALYCLNSAEINLRPGYSSWNSSIGSAYDPSEYVTVVRSFKGICYYCYVNGKTGVYTGAKEPGVYLSADADKQILTHVFEINGILGKNYVDIYYANGSEIIDGRLQCIYYVYSSNNEFSHFHGFRITNPKIYLESL
jgi:hypothetical protein